MEKKYRAPTLEEYIISQRTGFPYSKGSLARLLNHIGVASKLVNREVNMAGLVDILGETGKQNIQGESVKKLDIFANEQFKTILGSSSEICGLASEEDDSIVSWQDEVSKKGNYLVCIDPLDGSSNIDTNISVGTIFSIYRRISENGTPSVEKDYLQPGTDQMAAGYILYGSSTMMVYTTGMGVTGFTLDPSIGEFCLSHSKIVMPADGYMYSVNEGNYINFPKGVKKYIKYCQEDDPSSSRPYTSRYVGSLVADFHRNLLKGGVYIYPETTAHPSGKLRLTYECNPMAFLAEQSGGLATDGRGNRILEIKPESLHQRVPFFTGSKNMVEQAEDFMRKHELKD